MILRKIGGTGEATDELARGRGLEKGADGPRFAIGALVAGRGWGLGKLAITRFRYLQQHAHDSNPRVVPPTSPHDPKRSFQTTGKGVRPL